MPLSKLIRLLPNTLSFDKAAIPALTIQGPITYHTTLYVDEMLHKIPKNKDKIALIINSQGGCYAQAHIITKKLAQISKRNGAEVWTFAQEWALNAGFMLFSTGKRAYVDNTSVVGGIQVGQSKLLRGKFGEYVSTITYANEKSYLSEVNRQEEMDPTKKQEIEAINKKFSQQTAYQIRKLRAGKLSESIDLSSYYIGEEAVNNGLADAVDSYHRVYGTFNLSSDVRILQKSPIQKIFQKVRGVHLSD